MWDIEGERLVRFPLIRMVERGSSELDDELLHPAQRMTNPCARSPNHQLPWKNDLEW